MPTDDYARGYIHCRSDALLAIQLRMRELDTLAREADSEGAAALAGRYRFAARELLEANHQIGRLGDVEVAT